MKILLIIVLVVVVFPYVAGPLLLWINGSRIPPTKLEDVDPADTVEVNADSHFWKTTHFFSAAGFERLGNRVRESNGTGLSAYKELWRHRETGEAALVGAFMKATDPTFSNTFVAFLHECGDGAMVSTTNFNPGARTLLDPPGTSKVVVPTQDFTELRGLHQAHIAARSVRPLRVRDCVTLCKQLEAASHDVAVATKRFRSDGDTLRITLWGAVSMIWINLPPLKGKYDRNDHEALERLRMANPSSPGFNASSRAA